MAHCKLAFRVVHSADPVYLRVGSDTTTAEINEVLATAFGFPPGSDVILSREREREGTSLISSGCTPGDLSGSYLIAHEPLSTEFPPINLEKPAAEGGFYEEREQFLDLFEAASTKLNPNEQVFLEKQTLQGILEALRADLRGTGEDLIPRLMALIPSPTSEKYAVHHSVFVGVFVEFIARHFFDKEPLSGTEAVEDFAYVVAKLFEYISPPPKLLNRILDPFVPSPFVLQFILSITHCVPGEKAFLVMSRLVSDSFVTGLFNAFSLWDETFDDRFIHAFPFALVHKLVDATLAAVVAPMQAMEMIRQFSGHVLRYSERFGKALMRPMMKYIYMKAEQGHCPLLNVNTELASFVHNNLHRLRPIFRQFLVPYENVQLHVINYIVRWYKKFAYEPKGLFFLMVRLMNNMGFLSDGAILGFSRKCLAKPEKEGHNVLELLTLVLPEIPATEVPQPHEIGTSVRKIEAEYYAGFGVEL